MSTNDTRQGSLPWNLRAGVLLLAMGSLPFLAAWLLLLFDLDLPGACLFSSVTGIPCPACGATRAFTLAATGDPGFLEYNGVWVIGAALAAAVGAALPALPERAVVPIRKRSGTAAIAAVAALFLLGWAWAVVARGTILSA